MAKLNSDNTLPSAFELFKPSWEALLLNLSTFLQLILIPLLLVLLGTYIKGAAGSAILLIGEILGLVFYPAVYLTQLKSVQKKEIDFSTALKQGMPYFWRFLGLIICMSVIIGIGFILLIVPGIFMLRRYMLAPYYLLDRNMKIFDAMRASSEDSIKFSPAMFGLIGVYALIVIGSAIIQSLLGFAYVLVLAIYYVYYSAPAVRYIQIKTALKKSSGSVKN